MMAGAAAIIQARMGSGRFPGKMLRPLDGNSVLSWVIRRVRRAPSLSKVIVATSTHPRDSAIAEVAAREGVVVFRGSEDDVLERFACAASEAESDVLVRVCADNPFIDPNEIERLLGAFESQRPDYAFNHLDRLGSGYADGFGAEALSRQTLERLEVLAPRGPHREHVTSFIWDRADDFAILPVHPPAALKHPGLRFDVDLPSDLERLRMLIADGIRIDSSAKDIIEAQLSRFAIAPEYRSELVRRTGDLLDSLFPLCRSVAGAGNRETIRLIGEAVPLTPIEIASGTKVGDWTVPDEWAISGASVRDASGRTLIDFADSNLHVVNFSVGVRQEMTWEELAPRVHVHPDLPDAIPYRTSYYNRSWGFCATHRQRDRIRCADGPLSVNIEAEHRRGSMTMAETVIPGRSRREILFSSYICHPSMANDSLSGVVLGVLLARHVSSMPARRWTYRFVFVPETIGAVAYSEIRRNELALVDMGFVLTTAGGPGRFSWKQSFDPLHPVNSVVRKALLARGIQAKPHPFDVHGSDERQYSSHPTRINCASIFKDKYYDYPFYHTSLDNLDFVRPEYIVEAFEAYVAVIGELERRMVRCTKLTGGEAMLSKHGLYPTIGGSILPSRGEIAEIDLRLWTMFHSDGRLSIEEMADRMGVDVDIVRQTSDLLMSKGLLDDA